MLDAPARERALAALADVSREPALLGEQRLIFLAGRRAIVGECATGSGAGPRQVFAGQRGVREDVPLEARGR
eukprot:184108-Prymnesium_polylepis.1